MSRIGITLLTLLLAGCQGGPQPRSTQETISPKDYQECIQAAMDGNGQASTEKCNKVIQDSRE
ncbi:hypothetical protein EYY94_04715 [Obesumbacterium proteus]|uniref:ChiQ/YbfN family lipoprotein n=1 Tax=Obesumbacterium proteus TaxID=82983 RepID=UPI001034E1EA|nr:ChiQ/YbfN family lipoprotein [Obesumbacterium proteus]TBL76791.1 hypothetical protein EYY94_04715 [Obesumbacterium proteus]